MKKITLILFFLCSCFVSFAQVATVKTIRVVNPTAALGENIPVGTIIIDISTNKMYVAKTGIALTETITTSIANLDLKFAASSIVNDLTTGGAGDALSAEQGVTLKGLVEINTAKTGITSVQASAIDLNSVKATNVSTNLSIDVTTGARTIESSDGTNAIIPVATTSESGLMSKAIFDAVTANSSKAGITSGQASDITANTAKISYNGTASTKLASLETNADVTNVTNVTAAGALMDSEVTNLADVKAFDTSDYLASSVTTITSGQASAITANTAKATNVSTNLSITGTTDARTIESSDGSDAIIPVATTSESGLMSTTIFDAVTTISDTVTAISGAVTDLSNRKQSYLQIDTFSETNGTASAHALTKAVTPTATNEVNFKVSVNGGVVSATVITYNSGDNTITLSGISVAQYDVVTVVYTTNE